MFEVFKIYYNLYTYNQYDNKEMLYDYIYDLIIEKGPVFIKLGQILSTKTFIDERLRNKLLNLQHDNQIQHNRTKDELQQILPLNVLKNIEYNPIDGGSICNVYRADYLYENKEIPVVIKVCHNNIKTKTYNSIQLLKKLLCYGSYFNKNISMIKDFIHWKSYFKEITDQSDLRNEYQNIEKYRNNYKDKPFYRLLKIPTVYLHNKNYIIESYEEGYDINTFLEKYKSKTFETISLLSNVLQISLSKEINFYHSDMHRSNYFFNLNDKNEVVITLIDFGMVTSLDRQLVSNLNDSFNQQLFKINIDKILECIFNEMKRYNDESNVDKFVNYIKTISNEEVNILVPHVYFEDNSPFKKVINVNNYISDIINILDSAYIYGIKIDGKFVNLLNNLMLVDEMRLQYIKGEICELMENQMIAKIGSKDPFVKFWKFRRNYSIRKEFYK